MNEINTLNKNRQILWTTKSMTITTEKNLCKLNRNFDTASKTIRVFIKIKNVTA